jgi:hypothetical protein
MSTLRHIAITAVCLAASVLATARPCPAQTISRSLLAEGRVAGPAPQTIWFSVSDSGGQIQGYLLVRRPAEDAFVLMRVTSAARTLDTSGRATMAMAGPVLASQNAPDYLQPGRTTFCSVQDGGFEGPLADTFQGLGSVPLDLGNLSIQQILALIGPPMAGGFHAMIAGDLRVRNQ